MREKRERGKSTLEPNIFGQGERREERVMAVGSVHIGNRGDST